MWRSTARITSWGEMDGALVITHVRACVIWDEVAAWVLVQELLSIDPLYEICEMREERGGLREIETNRRG